MHQLEQYFNGEQSWITYSNNFGDQWTGSDTQSQLLALCNNRIDLAKVIDHHLRGGSIRWMHSKIPVLDNLTPAECLKDDMLMNRLKECLMRFP